MKRLLGLSALILAAATGCRMCASPYDYCGPVVECGCMGGGDYGGGCGNGEPSQEMMDDHSAPVEGEMIAPPNAPATPTPANSSSYHGSTGRRFNPTYAAR
ncbi:MAG TPA: hypothetical protein VGJ04_03380 [Pirellulales bacterium]|jgi:hypothetical protein